MNHSTGSILSHRKRGDHYMPEHLPNVSSLKNKIIFLCISVFCIAFICNALCPVTSMIACSGMIGVTAALKMITILSTSKKQRTEEHKYATHIESITEFPLYTIIVPIFMERKQDIKRIRYNIKKLQYPNIEVLYITEEIDLVVNSIFAQMTLESYEKYITIPRIAPFTKPKACNYALEFARGKYITIYDIEDKPHPYQLHCAHYMFSNDKNLACIQFPLEFEEGYTIHEMWQRIDYILWYNCMLNAFRMQNVPLPLGGTSNHFVTHDLRMAGGWDSYNVTEDAELGIRLFHLGYKMQFCNAFTTIESPVLNIRNLYNQRVRWAKGHLITTIQTAPMLLNNKKFYAATVVVYFLLLPWIIFVLSVMVFLLSITNAEIYHNNTTISIICINILGFFAMPFVYFIFIKKMRTVKMIIPVLTYNIFCIFYLGIFWKALLECVNAPHKWYKTVR